jgi:hypothetical protein
MVFSHFQQYFSYIVLFVLFWWMKPKYPEKTADLPQVTDKLYHINVVSSTPRMNGIRTHNVSGDM